MVATQNKNISAVRVHTGIVALRGMLHAVSMRDQLLADHAHSSESVFRIQGRRASWRYVGRRRNNFRLPI